MKLIKWLIEKYQMWTRKRKFKKKLEELKKRDPFIYNH
jgi:hypothetical protein